MAIIRWEPVRELGAIQSEMNRLFNSFFDEPAAGTGRNTVRRWIPAMDLVQSGGQLILRADLPGLSEQDVQIELQDGVLTISGERKAEHDEESQGYLRVERSWGAFSRSLALPDGIDPEAVKASFDRGVLEIRIPKPEARQPRKVEISVESARPETIEGSATAAPEGTSHGGERESASRNAESVGAAA